MTTWNGGVAFARYIEGHGYSEVRLADGVAPGSSHVATLPQGYWAGSIVGVVGDDLLFLVGSEFQGTEVWKTDGTPEGTRRVHGTAIPFNDTITAFDATVGDDGVAFVFGGESGVHVLCQWGGPALGGENAPPQEESCVQMYSDRVASVDGTLYFSAADGEHGYELWSFTLPPDGDFDDSGVIDAADIDLLQAAVRSAAHDAAFDLTGDARVDAADVSRLVVDILKTQFGDANLDRVVDRRDVAILAANFGRTDAPGWRNGDASGDGRVGLRDLALAQANFAPTPPPAADAVLAGVSASPRHRAAQRERLVAHRRVPSDAVASDEVDAAPARLSAVARKSARRAVARTTNAR
jgi:hypothetical protein